MRRFTDLKEPERAWQAEHLACKAAMRLGRREEAAARMERCYRYLEGVRQRLSGRWRETKVLNVFEKKFVELTKRIKIGNPLDETVFMGPVINKAAAAEKIARYNDLARKEGAEVLCNGRILDSEPYKNGYFMSPFVYRMQNNPKSRVLREEVFGPHVAIISVKNLAEAIEVYNDTDYGLSCAVITEDYRKAKRIRDDCEYGLGYVNLPTIGAEVHLPFGGVKKSGTGLPSASTLIDVVTHRTAWTINYAKEIKMAQGLTVKL